MSAGHNISHLSDKKRTLATELGGGLQPPVSLFTQTSGYTCLFFHKYTQLNQHFFFAVRPRINLNLNDSLLSPERPCRIPPGPTVYFSLIPAALARTLACLPSRYSSCTPRGLFIRR